MTEVVFGLMPLGAPISRDMERLERRLWDAGVWHRFIEKPETVHTADAAKASGLPIEAFTKNLVWNSERGPVLLIVRGDMSVDLEAAAKAAGVKKLLKVPFSDAVRISGYLPGATPSVFHASPMIVVVDEEVAKLETLICGGGDREHLLELRSADVIRLNNAAVEKIAKRDLK